MEFFQTKPKTELELLEAQIKLAEIPHIEGIIVDDNHKISEDAKWGHELSKDKIKWYKYFGM
jgi:hypothetical protein